MFKFTIRELLLLTLAVGLGVGWWIDRMALVSVARRNADGAVAADEKAHVLELAMLVEGFELDRSIPGRIVVNPPDGEARNWPERIARQKTR